MNNGKTKYSALIVASITSFMAPFMISAVNIALPDIVKDLSFDAVLLSWINTAYLLAAVVFLVPIAKLADIYGRKKIFASGIALFTLSIFLTAFVDPIASVVVSVFPLVDSITIFMILRVFQGIGSAFVMTTGVAILTSVFPPKERGFALGFVVAAVYVGLSAGPSIGGIITEHFGWRSIFIAITPIGLLTLGLTLLFIKGEWAESKGQKFDLLGSIIYGLATVIFLYGATRLPEKSGIMLTAIGFLLLLAFVFFETKIKHPIFDIRVFLNNKVFAFSNTAALINYSGSFSVILLMSLYLQYIKGMTPKEAGIVIIVQPVIQAVFSPVAGKLSDRVEPGIISSIGMTLTALGLFMLIFIAQTTPISYILVTLSLLGLGFALFSSPNMNAIMGSVERRYYSIASGMASTMRVFGQMISMAIVTIVFSIIIGRKKITPETYPQFLEAVAIIFMISSALCCIGIFFSLTRGKLHSKPPE